MGSRSAGSPFLVMHTWCPPVRVGYGSRASGRLANRISSEHFFNIRHFARETPGRTMCKKGPVYIKGELQCVAVWCNVLDTRIHERRRTKEICKKTSTHENETCKKRRVGPTQRPTGETTKSKICEKHLQKDEHT